MAYEPCLNPHCKSHGRPHPNCRCYEYAHGGSVCAGKHKRTCKYFVDGGPVSPALFADGGEINPMAARTAHPTVTLGHVAIQHGLLGLLKKVGKFNLSDPDKHHQTIERAKGLFSQGDYEKAAELLHGHPLSGSTSKNNLNHIAGHLSRNIQSFETNPAALRSSIDYLNDAIKGHSAMDAHMDNMLGSGKLSIEPDEDGIESLKDHLDSVKERPSQLLEIGGQLGHYLPDHAGALGATASASTDYLNALKPKTSQASPMDEPIKPEKGAMASWERHLDIAQNPLRILQHVKDGTLLQKDMVTLHTLYPGLHMSMLNKAGEKLINAKAKGTEIPYRQKQALSTLLGQPLDATMTPAAMQAIIQSAGGQQAQKQQDKQKKENRKATAAELNAIEKVDSLYETPIERRLINKRD